MKRDIPFGKPLIGDEERQAVMGVLSGTTLTHGPLVKDFETEFLRYTQAQYAIAVSSCTAALHLTYFALGLKPGDEVIVPAQTHTATAHAVEFCGARPVFIDADEKTGNIDIEQMEQHISDKTRAISVVHYLGMPVDMARIHKLSQKYGLYVVEDCALALGSFLDGIHAGTTSHAGCFSFYPVKHITTAEGGMLLTNNVNIAELVSRQRAFGIDRNVVSDRKVAGLYDVEELGFNYRLNEIGAALGLEQMKKLPEFLKQRKENYDVLSQGLNTVDEIETLQSSHGSFKSSYYCHSMLLKDSLQDKRFEIMELLKQEGIGTSIYYPRPVPFMKYYQEKYRFGLNEFPIARKISGRSIALPVGPHLSPDDMNYIVEGVKKAIWEVKRYA